MLFEKLPSLATMNTKNMATKLVLILVFLFVSTARSQTSHEFIESLIKISKANYPKKSVDSLYTKYNNILFFFNPNSQLASEIKGTSVKYFPLEDFKLSSFYKDNIDLLLKDTSLYKQTFGSFVVAAANDTSKITEIEQILGKTNDSSFWLANILMVLKTKNPAPLIKTIRRLADEESSTLLIEAFLRLDSNTLEQFGIDSIKSTDPLTQFLAIRSLAIGIPTSRKINDLRDIATSGNSKLKGWAISVLAKFQAPDMFLLLDKYLLDPDLRQISLAAISNSPSAKDKEHIASYNSKRTLDKDLLIALIGSTQEGSVRKALELMEDGNLPEDYNAYVDYTPMITDDRYYEDVCKTLEKSKNQSKIYLLYNYFSTRKDDRTIYFLLKNIAKPNLMNMERLAIRSQLLKRNSVLIEKALPKLMKGATIKDVGLIDLLIQYKNHQFDELVRSWTQNKTLEKAYFDLCQTHLKNSNN
jgi:hypothetical protein